jgi:tRNA-2-methylthio-N6-dimethylallyladenosine synthase
MKRLYTRQEYLAMVDHARRVIPGVTFSSDFIVGFPGETEDDFAATMRVMASARFDTAFMFQFSPRPGTAAATMDHQLPPEVVQRRFDRLVALQNEITFARNRERVGRTEEVMVEGPSKRDPLTLSTRTRGNRIVHVPGTRGAGDIFDVEITRAAPHYLVGRSAVSEMAS